MSENTKGIQKFALLELLDRVTFKEIFLVWMGILIFFGIIYFGLSNTGIGKVYVTKTGEELTGIDGFFNAVYFSFITATSTGFGDIVPTGISKLFALIEVIVGMVIFGVIISKIVSVKQETILDEIYNISFDEKINRLRGLLQLFRSDVNKIIERVEHNLLSKKRAEELWTVFSALDNSLSEIIKILFQNKKDVKYLKKIDEVNFELILNSIKSSLAKALELIIILNMREIKWKNENIDNVIISIINHANQVNENCRGKYSSKIDERLEDNNKIIKEVEYHLKNS